MKFIYLNFIFILSSCCLGTRKCPQTQLSAAFSIVSSTNNQDLVFGPNSVYDKDSIKFYSLNGNDTIYHNYYGGPFSDNTQDSFLIVGFDYSKMETVFVKLNAFDIDTLKVIYETVSPQCCSQYSLISEFAYNNAMLETNDQYKTIIKK